MDEDSNKMYINTYKQDIMKWSIIYCSVLNVKCPNHLICLLFIQPLLELIILIKTYILYIYIV